MKTHLPQHQLLFLLIVLLALAALPADALAQTQGDNVVNAAGAVLDEIMAVPAKQIPQSMLAEARGVAIIPNLVKGGFVIGVRHGRGVMLVRDDAGNWLPPTFVSMTGGSVGWQAGLQSTDVVLVFKTRKSVDNLMGGKFTIGVDAAAAAGPVGRQATAATDANLSAEIYSYSRSRGLFAGVSVDGSALQVDNQAATAYYRGGTPGQLAPVPESAVRLMNRLAQYTGSPQIAVAPQIQQPLQVQQVQSGLPPQSEMVRRQLVASWQQFSLILDEQWQAYLALPGDVLSGGQAISIADLNATMQRYGTIASNPQYASLAQRHEFVATYQLLREYVTLQSTEVGKLTLPPPPSAPVNSAGAARGRY